MSGSGGDGGEVPVTSIADVDEMLATLLQNATSWIAFQFEFQNGRPAVPIGDDRYWRDPTSLQPVALILCGFIGSGREGEFHLFCLDLRGAGRVQRIESLFRMPVPFIGHHMQTDLCCLWNLNLPTPATVWDLHLAEQALRLGQDHKRYQAAYSADLDVVAAKDAEKSQTEKCSIYGLCEKYKVQLPADAQQELLGRRFLLRLQMQEWSEERLKISMAVVRAMAELYLPQRRAADLCNAAKHLDVVEMPWLIVNAKMHWDGVFVDPAKLQKLGSACKGHADRLAVELKADGLADPGSPQALMQYFKQKGLLDLFKQGGELSFDDDALKAAEDYDEAICKLRLYRKARRIGADKFVKGELVGSDGRFHPIHKQLAAATGRNSTIAPNIAGIGRALRPLIVPQDEKTGIGEVDLSQIEVGIAAAIHEDVKLIEMFNSGDVYTRMVREFHAGKLTDEDQTMDDDELRRRRPRLREEMKTFTLAVMYNIGEEPLSRRFGVSVEDAADAKIRFLDMFPALRDGLEHSSTYGKIRGFVEICTGLRRSRPPGSVRLTGRWEENWMRNTPIQGSSAVVFKVAGIRLARLLPQYGARLILPLHDAYVFESPRECLEDVAGLVKQVMCQSVQEYFPALRPKAEVNIRRPECWNKDGLFESLEIWMNNPLQAEEYLARGRKSALNDT